MFNFKQFLFLHIFIFTILLALKFHYIYRFLCNFGQTTIYLIMLLKRLSINSSLLCLLVVLQKAFQHSNWTKKQNAWNAMEGQGCQTKLNWCHKSSIIPTHVLFTHYQFFMGPRRVPSSYKVTKNINCLLPVIIFFTVWKKDHELKWISFFSPNMICWIHLTLDVSQLRPADGSISKVTAWKFPQ